MSGRTSSLLWLFGTVVLGLGVANRPAVAQSGSGQLSTPQVQRLGLKLMWSTHVQVDSGYGRLKFLTQHVSATRSITLREITYDGGRYVVSERDLDRFGQPLGVAGAKKVAELRYSELTRTQRNPKAQSIAVPQITVYAVTDTGIVQAIDAETGRSLWTAGIGNSRSPIEAVGASDEYVAAISGSDLHILKADNGEVLWKRRVVGAPGAGPCVSDSMVFVPMISGAMEAYPLADTTIPPTIFQSYGRAMIQPICTGNSVAWPTDRGHLYVSTAASNEIRYRIEAQKSIGAAASMLPPDKLVMASVDGFVYCVNEISGTLQWRLSIGESVTATPMVFGGLVFVVSDEEKLYCIDGMSGEEKWSTSDLVQVVGASSSRLYGLTANRTLVIHDLQTGSRMGALSGTWVEVPYENRETDRIVIATARGVVQCLREVQNEHPQLHITLTKKEAAAPVKRKPKPTAEPTGETPGQPADNAVDPFGGAPAATPPAEATPAAPPADAAKGADPFGG